MMTINQEKEKNENNTSQTCQISSNTLFHIFNYFPTCETVKLFSARLKFEALRGRLIFVS